MSMVYLMVPGAFVLAGLAIWAFIRAARAGQFDDLETPAHRMLLDDDGSPPIS
jgi:cbb3-type cytochrome oxidase maturation protein